MLLRAQTVFLVRPNSNIARLGKTERFRRYCSGMDKQSEASKNTGDAMSNSFGEGYASRSDEEGFGGVYSDTTQQLKKNDQHVDEDSAEYDKTQGSEVKEKEKGRNSHEDSACK